MANLISQKKIKVAWFASGFVGRSASGTAQVAKKTILNLILNHSNEVKIVIIAKTKVTAIFPVTLAPPGKRPKRLLNNIKKNKVRR